MFFIIFCFLLLSSSLGAGGYFIFQLSPCQLFLKWKNTFILNLTRHIKACHTLTIEQQPQMESIWAKQCMYVITSHGELLTAEQAGGSPPLLSVWRWSSSQTHWLNNPDNHDPLGASQGFSGVLYITCNNVMFGFCLVCFVLVFFFFL